MNSTKLIYISAGEVSGDRHGASLVRALKSRHPEWEFIGMGGHFMEAAGVALHSDITAQSTVGIVEPLRHIPRIISAYFKSKRVIQERRPDLVIVIDSQGFHMKLLQWLKKLSIRSVYFIAPQEWHWGTDAGGREVCARTTKILAIFRGEYEFYNRLCAKAAFVGHPIMDMPGPSVSEEAFRRQLGIDHRPILGIFPGSRFQELKLVAPILLKAAKEIKRDVHVVVSLSSPKFRQQLEALVAPYGWSIYSGNSRDLIYYSNLSLVSSGTVSVEHAILGTPALVVYKLARPTYWFGTWLLKRRIGRIPYMSMVNELLNEHLMPEFLQDQATPERIAAKAVSLLDNVYDYNKICEGYNRVRHLFGDPGCFERAASEIEMLLITPKKEN